MTPAAAELLATLERDHDRARSALTVDTGPTMAGVVLLAAHLAAVEHTIQPHAPNAGDHDGDHSGRELKRWVRLLERQLAGDQTAPDDARHTVGELLRRLDAHADQERAAVAALADELDDTAVRSLAERYVHAFEHGPTRPHPHGAHAGRLEPLVYAFNRAWDRLVDAMDARVTPLPRTDRRPTRVGRWGRYLLGVSDVHEFGDQELGRRR